MTSNYSVLLIIGSGRSGSTLFGDALSAASPDATFAGEVMNVWTKSLMKPTICSCGDLTDTCAFWAPILKQRRSRADWATTSRTVAELIRPRTSLACAVGRGVERSAEALGDELQATYRDIALSSDVGTIVDSSKAPAYAAVMAASGVPLAGVVQLVRDPRAVAFSRRRKGTADAGKGRTMQETQTSALYSSGRWVVDNFAARRVCARLTVPTLQIAYEEFVRSPESVVDRVWKTVGRETTPWIEQQSFTRKMNHVATGNRSRFGGQNVTIRADDAWKTSMSRFDRAVVASTSFLSGPFLGR